MLKQKLIHLKRRCLSYLMAYGIKFFIKVLLKTCRIQIRGLETFNDKAKQFPCILMLWHNRLVILPEFLSSRVPQFTYTGFISKSHDADPLAILTSSYACGRTVRVPHNARHFALSRLIGTLKNNGQILIITPDGPRGPRYEIKPGIILAAKETGAYVFPFSWNADRFWTLRTWDKMRIPKPFAKIEAVFGQPISLDKEAAKEYKEDSSVLKAALDSLETG